MSHHTPVQIKVQGGTSTRPTNVVQVINRLPPATPTVASPQRFTAPVTVRTISSPSPNVQYSQNVEDINQFAGQQVIQHQQPVQVQYGSFGYGAINLPLGAPGAFMGAPGFGGLNTGRKQCNCTKSNCLKLYCECFAQGQLCQNCNCTNCMNNLAHEEERRRAVKMTLERNPTAFNPKIGRGEGERKHTKGCNCKRSNCLKNYCECYEAKISCSALCRCHGCLNTEDSIERRSLLRLSALGSLKSKHNNSYKKILSIPPSETLPHSFFTWETIEAMVGCMLAQAEDAEQRDLSLAEQERTILEEFGRSIERVIKAASKAQIRPISSSLMHSDPNGGMGLEDDRHMHHERIGRAGGQGGEIHHHRSHLIRQGSDDEEYIDDEEAAQHIAGLDPEEQDQGAYIGDEGEELAARAHRSRPPLRGRLKVSEDDNEQSGSQRKPRSGSRGLTNMMDNLHMAPATGSSRSGRRHVPSRRFQDEEDY